MDDLRSGKFDVPIYSRALLVCCVSSLITFDINLNICVYFSLVCTRLFNKKVDPTRSSEFDRTADVVCTPDDISVFFDRAFIVGA